MSAGLNGRDQRGGGRLGSIAGSSPLPRDAHKPRPPPSTHYHRFPSLFSFSLVLILRNPFLTTNRVLAPSTFSVIQSPAFSLSILTPLHLPPFNLSPSSHTSLLPAISPALHTFPFLDANHIHLAEPPGEKGQFRDWQRWPSPDHRPRSPDSPTPVKSTLISHHLRRC